MFCGKCGQLNTEKEEYCIRCGHKLIVIRPFSSSKEDTSRLKQKFEGISSKIYEHPDDARALNVLQSIPVMPELIKEVFKYWHNLNYEVILTANSVKVTEKQFPDIYEVFKDCGEILDIKKMPKFYITQDPQAHSYSTGAEDTFLVISSALIDMMNRDELYFIIGHELGHIKSDHVLYHDLANWIKNVASTVGTLTLGIGDVIGKGIMTAIVTWIKGSELTADRAGLLCCQDIDVATKSLIKTVLGSRKLFSQISIEEYLRQGEELEKDDEKSFAFKAVKMMQNASLTQPFTTRRVKHLQEWVKSTSYITIIDGDYLSTTGSVIEKVEETDELECEHCKVKLDKEETSCPLCGQEVFKAPLICPECFKDLKPHYKKCPYCKKNLYPSRAKRWISGKYKSLKSLYNPFHKS